MLGLLERFGDGLYPRSHYGRASILGWVGSRGQKADLWMAVKLVPLTKQKQQNWHHYQAWLTAPESSGDDEVPSSDRETEAEKTERLRRLRRKQFKLGFEATDRAFYESLLGSLRDAAAIAKDLEDFGREHLVAAGVEVTELPNYKDLRGALQDMTSAATDLLGRKPAPIVEGPDPGSTALVQDSAMSHADAPAGMAGPSTPEVMVARAAEQLRATDPRSPVSYLVLRGLRWGELRAGGKEPDPRALSAPRPEQRTGVKSLFMEKRWGEVLDMGEKVMASESGRAWLDLQRYEILAAEQMGPEYAVLAGALRQALISLLADLPSLATATLMDDSAAASPETVAWLKGTGLLVSPSGTAEPDAADGEPDLSRRSVSTSLSRAAVLVRAGDAHGAIQLLIGRAEREGNERLRFLLKTEAAEVMVDHGMKVVARPILDELHQLIQDHKLEDWEEADTVARPIGLLSRCLDDGDSALRQSLHSRLAKLDPLLAMRIRGGPGDNSSAASGEG
jgi:type VI secretion system protein ImpA